ncbi:MAG: hypothetical protein KIT22_20635 [Verrucomicrobiae bacterium]|nr:hypothetical protein [Verrucomicrobiae bacterium]
MSDPSRGVCRFIWEQEDPGPVWLEFAFLGGAEQRVRMKRVGGRWVAEIRRQSGWIRYGFRTASGIRPDRHPATVRDALGRRLSFAVLTPSVPRRSPEKPA